MRKTWACEAWKEKAYRTVAHSSSLPEDNGKVYISQWPAGLTRKRNGKKRQYLCFCYVGFDPLFFLNFPFWVWQCYRRVMLNLCSCPLIQPDSSPFTNFLHLTYSISSVEQLLLTNWPDTPQYRGDVWSITTMLNDRPKWTNSQLSMWGP